MVYIIIIISFFTPYFHLSRKGDISSHTSVGPSQSSSLTHKFQITITDFHQIWWKDVS